MRQAVDNVQPKTYNLLGIGGEKYNCQDWISDIKTEYHKLYFEQIITPGGDQVLK